MRKLLCALAAATALAGGSIVTAGTASAVNRDDYDVNLDNIPDHVLYQVSGYITWNNRTAFVHGDIVGNPLITNSTVLQAHFDAFAGSTLVDPQTRTTKPGQPLPFGFTIGDPNLSGGIDRIRITLCDVTTKPQTCSHQYNYLKNS